MKDLRLDAVKLIIFDVDGTLYDQSKLRKKMFLALISYYILRPWRYRDIIILYHFRKEREKHAGLKVENLKQMQYDWCLSKVNTTLKRVKEVTDKWIFNFPNKYLQECMYPGVKSFFEELEKKQVLKAIYSDYDATAKLEYMGLKADLIVSSTDEYIDALKPLPNGLNYIISEMEISDKRNCLFIGDRDELDGACAKSAGIPFLLINKDESAHHLYLNLVVELNTI